MAAHRLRSVARHYDVDIDWERVSVYTADLPEQDMGMTPQHYRDLAARIDVIYHSASAVNFIQPYSYMKRDNVDGLQQILRFAARDHLKPMVLLSSISVYSWGHLFTGKRLMNEDDDLDQNLQAVSTDLGYMRAKWVMEKIAELAAHHGLPIMVFRLGYATCHTRTGMSAGYQWWGRLVRTCLTVGALPNLLELREGLTTVDYMVDAITAISRQPTALGTNFNLVPSLNNALTLKEFFELLNRHCGHHLDVIPYDQWVDRWKNDRTTPLYPLRSMFTDRVLDGKATVELYQHTYRWGTQNLHHHLEGTNIREPEFTKDILDRYLHQLLTGALPPGSGHA